MRPGTNPVNDKQAIKLQEHTEDSANEISKDALVDYDELSNN
jgi:hypothetical protein